MDRTEYITVKTDPDSLASAVQAKLDDGYMPLGGPGFYKENYHSDGEPLKRVWAVQAMYKCPPEPPPQPPPTKEQFIEMAKENFMNSGMGEVVEESPIVDAR